jgi:hypothetical protein
MRVRVRQPNFIVRLPRAPASSPAEAYRLNRHYWLFGYRSVLVPIQGTAAVALGRSKGVPSIRTPPGFLKAFFFSLRGFSSLGVLFPGSVSVKRA